MLEMPFPSVPRLPRLIPLLALVLLFAGCSKDNPAGPNRVPLTLRAMGTGASSASALHAARIGSADYAAAASADTIPVTFTRALLVIRDIRFVLGESDEGEDESDSLDAENDST